jgi:1-deoxy-D-xylulose-5-phosphate reductoisomerase
MKKLSILGSTGSIGTQTLDIVKNNPHEFKVVGLTANKNIKLLKNQINEFKPEAVAVMDNEKADLLKEDVDINVYSGIDGIIKIAALDETDTVVNSLVGSIGVKPTVEAIRNKKNIALANKETLVTAGSIVMEEGENVNYIYCNDLIYSKTPISEDGVVQKTIEYDIKLVLDSKDKTDKGYKVIFSKCY